MDANEQIRTSRGQYPPLSSKLGYNTMTGDPCLRFEFPGDALQMQRCPRVSSGPASIVDLAYLATDRGGREEVKSSQLVSIASKTGPLFGLPENEAVGDWLAESFLVGTVLAIQAGINDSVFEGMDKGFGFSGETLVSKLVVSASTSARPFRLYSVDVPLPETVTESFFRGMPAFPAVRKSHFEGMTDYAVLLLASGDDFGDALHEERGALDGSEVDDNEAARGLHLQAMLFSFDGDISKDDFAAVLDTFGLLEQIGAPIVLEGNDGQDFVGENLFGYGLSGDLDARVSALSEEDSPHLQKLVHALMSLRLRGIGVDLFESSEEDAYMVFPSYASYLWYQLFAQLCNVELGLCEECGKRFVLTGHRGSKRKYCSEACKTKAKNVRTGKARDDARSFFLEDGLSVEQVARAVYGWAFVEGGDETDKSLSNYMETVRKHLREFPLLKRRLDASLRECDDFDFVVRCVGEGLFSWGHVIERAKRLSSGETMEKIALLAEEGMSDR